ncbi:MAG: hypothetical protein ABI401_02490 [Candidatus Dormibacter sp.]
MRARDLLDRLPFKSKASRDRQDADRLRTRHHESMRERQDHYRAITQTDADGRDTRV